MQVLNRKLENNPNEKPMDLITEIQRVIVKINDLLSHPSEAEYLVDLLPKEAIKRFGRERVVEAARVVLKESVSPELTEKFNALWKEFGERYFDSFLMSLQEVEVRYMIGGRSHHHGPVQIPASSEPIMVERMLDEMVSRYSHNCGECYRKESNRAYIAGAPMSVNPNQRHLSAEEFIRQEARVPNDSEKEWLMHQGDLLPTDLVPAKAESTPQEQGTSSAPCCCPVHKTGK